MKFKRIGLVMKPDVKNPKGVHDVLAFLHKNGAEFFVEEHSRKFFPKGVASAPLKGAKIDLLLVIGGDGTIFRAVRTAAHSCPILSIHEGRVGFLSEMTFEESSDLLPKFLKGEGHIEERNLLSVKAYRGKKLLHESEVVNEAVISQGSIARLIDLRSEVNGEELTTFRSDGLILATPTGSTAYSLAAGGPVVHPRLSAIILTPINSHSFTQKPIVLPGDVTVLTEVMNKERENMPTQVSLTLDGQQYVPLQCGDTVIVKTAKRTVQFLRRKEETFLQTLRKKLRWGEQSGG